MAIEYRVRREAARAAGMREAGHVLRVERRVDAASVLAWEPVKAPGSTVKPMSFFSLTSAMDAVRRGIIADRAAASRLGFAAGSHEHHTAPIEALAGAEPDAVLFYAEVRITLVAL